MHEPHRPSLPAPGIGTASLWEPRRSPLGLIHSVTRQKPPYFYYIRGRLLLLRSGNAESARCRIRHIPGGANRNRREGRRGRGQLDLLDCLEKLHLWVYPSRFQNWVFIWVHSGNWLPALYRPGKLPRSAFCSGGRFTRAALPTGESLSRLLCPRPVGKVQKVLD